MAARFFDQAPERDLGELWHARPQCPRFCPRFNMACPDIFGHMQARMDTAMSRIISSFQCVIFFQPQPFRPSRAVFGGPQLHQEMPSPFALQDFLRVDLSQRRSMISFGAMRPKLIAIMIVPAVNPSAIVALRRSKVVCEPSASCRTPLAILNK
jgi:hypothetical protein